MLSLTSQFLVFRHSVPIRHFANIISLRQANKAIQRSNDQVIINPYTLEGSNPILKESPQILGVKEIPRSNEQINQLTWFQRLRNVFDKEKNKKVREKLIKEYNTPYWKDLTELRKHGEKLWEANPELVNTEKALYMPNIKACSLSNPKIDTTDLLQNQTSLVVISFNQYGEDHVKTFIETFYKNFSNHAKIQFMKVTIEPNFAKTFIIKLFVIPSLRRNIPKSLHKNYIFTFNKDPILFEALGMNNLYRGYTFLVDSNCKIRWSAHGKATSNELETMLRLTEFLDNQNHSNVR
ncbi:108_t:CDS:2 [Cetraspora pellucida]|uniref:108_t:CDS:1 n=1 Tax=Cetraspora pellucida TaxID=1433469 RepID=A0A9N9AM05_9GLOM|nr:108_t:CDS:2 [Cetraspora pellucida]